MFPQLYRIRGCERQSCSVGGETAKYIPQLANVNPELFSLSVCTIDGQRYHIGLRRADICTVVLDSRMSLSFTLFRRRRHHVYDSVGLFPHQLHARCR